MSIHNYSPAELEPRNLSKEERVDPFQVIHGLFDYAHLPQIRESLWGWLKLTVSGTYHRESLTDKSNVIYLYERIAQLVEAAHILHRQGKYRGKS
jgi:hypothetical protein